LRGVMLMVDWLNSFEKVSGCGSFPQQHLNENNDENPILLLSDYHSSTLPHYRGGGLSPTALARRRGGALSPSTFFRNYVEDGMTYGN
jgi:hypothetical protein